MNKKPEAVVTLRFDAEIIDAVQRRAQKRGHEFAEEVMWLVVEGLGDELPSAFRDWLRRREEIVQRFGLKAVAIQALAIKAEGWRGDIIAETGRLLMEEKPWADGYQALLGADPFDKRVKMKARINPMLGRRAKLLLGAKTGKPFPVKQPSIFTTSSTLLQPLPDTA